MSLTITATLGPIQAKAILAKKSEMEGDGRMTAQNSAADSDVEGLRRQRTSLDRLLDQPGPLDRFAQDEGPAERT
ncbi:hypothetical protein [Sphingomonas sp.]|jgi:hypothetical protein|uniref:hypothetical protein n=1 Tax=Sphingomonas sp. TaxID=28214 RepID=UPI0035C82537